MDTNYISLLNLTYEIEGLLLLHINRGEEASPEMTDLLKKKIAQLATACPADAPEKVEQPAAAPQPAVSIPCSEPVNDKEEYNDDFAEEETGTEESLPSAEECRAVMAEEKTADDEAVAESVTFEETEDAEPEAGEEQPDAREEAQPDAPVRLEDKLSRERAKDIFKAFTINDKFRFRRELFRNSQEEFDETLDVIAQMNTFDEAEDYFYNDLCWDADNEDVKEFMETVKKHF